MVSELTSHNHRLPIDETINIIYTRIFGIKTCAISIWEIRMRMPCRNSINAFDTSNLVTFIFLVLSVFIVTNTRVSCDQNIVSSCSFHLRNNCLHSLHWIVNGYLTFKIGLIPNQNLCWKDTSNTDF